MGKLPEGFGLDSFLTPEQCAEWLGIERHALSVHSAGKHSKIPAFRFNQKLVRYHPRTIIAKLAADAGVPFEVVEASLNIRKKSGL